MDGKYYLIDNQLAARPLSDYLSKNGTWWGRGKVDAEFRRGKVVGSDSGKALPITLDGDLDPGTLYESSVDGSIRYYLPEYHLNIVDGRYTSSLKWRDENSDPSGPLAYLTLEVIGTAPTALPGIVLQEIPHQLLARIGYQMKVQDGAAHPAPNPAAPFVGMWTNVDSHTRGMTTLEVIVNEDRTLSFHAFGKCHPTDCDWKLTQASLKGDSLVGVYDFGFKTTTITVRRCGSQLTAELINHFAPGDGRADYTEHDTLAAANNQAAAAAVSTLPFIWIEVGSLDVAGGGVRRVRLPIPDKRDFDRLYQVMTDGSFNTRLELRCFATAGRRTWQQFVLGDIAPAVRNNIMANTNLFLTDLVKEKAFIGSSLALGNDSDHAPTSRDERKPRREKNIHPPLLKRGTAPAASNTAPNDSPRIVAMQPVQYQAFAIPLAKVIAASDLEFTISGKTSKALPVKSVVDDTGRPALIEIPVETVQEISSFWFLAETNSYMFDIPDDIRPGSSHVLLRMEVRDGSGRVTGTFYQDSAYADQFYYEPQEFRLPRQDTPPYLPDVRFVFFDLIEEAHEGTAVSSARGSEAIVDYKVQLAYRLVPYLDPMLLDQASKQVPGVKARFNALAPENSILTLKVPQDGASLDLVEISRPSATVRFDQGIVDQLELSRTEFERVFSFLQVTGGRIDGLVEALLLSNIKTRVPVTLSLEKNCGTVFGHIYLGPQGDGLHRVRLINRIESPVIINAIYSLSLGGNVYAYSQTDPEQTIQPGDHFDLDYRVVPPDAVIVDMDPSLSISISPDAARLWSQLFINRGYTSETFTINLFTEPDFFGQASPDGGDPVTGLKVEFECGPEINLTADNLSVDVTLRKPLLPFLMKSPDSCSYRYKLTNLLGSDGDPGAASDDWVEDSGPLSVAPLGVS